MELASEFLTTTSELKVFNRVRMLHNVVSLIDIRSANGKKLYLIFTTSSAYEVDQNNFKWLTKHHVSSNDFTTWRKTLEYMFPNGQLASTRTLRSWILDKQSDWLEHWDWFVTADVEFLYLQNGPSLWHCFLRRPNFSEWNTE